MQFLFLFAYHILVRFEKVIWVADLGILGYEVLAGDEFPVNGSREKFFSSIPEDYDLEIFESLVRRAREKIPRDYYLFFNLKPTTFLLFPDKVVNVLGYRDVLELREDFISTDLLRELSRLRRTYGILLSLDDFGRGASNFERLKLLFPNFVKVDFSLFSHWELPQVRELILKSGNFYVIAEKVESPKDFYVAKSYGFHLAQGFYVEDLIKKSFSEQGSEDIRM